jgi:hypothetical protein
VGRFLHALRWWLQRRFVGARGGLAQRLAANTPIATAWYSLNAFTSYSIRSGRPFATKHGGPPIPADHVDLVAAFFDQEVTALELISPRFYHLDVCFCALSGGEIFHYPPAFSAASLAAIREIVASEDLIEATDEDAARFNVNAVNIDRRLVMASASPHLVARLAERGYGVTEVDLLPFIMSGGGAYCMTLRLDRCSIEPGAFLRAAE